MSQDDRLVAASLERTCLLQSLWLDALSLRVTSCRREAEANGMRSKHFRMPVADPCGGLQRGPHVLQSKIERAGINAAMPHHDAIGNGDPGQLVGFAESDASTEMSQRGGHPAVHIHRVRQATQCAGLPFRRIDTPCRFECQLMLAAALAQTSTREKEIAAKIVGF